MADVNSTWFRNRLVDKRLSQRQLARVIGVDPAAVSLMLRGKRKMDVSEAGAIAKALGVPVDEVLRHAGVDVRGVEANGSVPVVGWVDDQGVVTMERAMGPTVVPFLGGAGASDGVVALRIQTNERMDGWLVFYREVARQGVSLEAQGRLCVVELESGQKLLRAVRRGYAPGEHVLGGWFVERSGSIRIASAAPVICLWQG